MDINKVLIEYDNLFGVVSLEEIQEYLSAKIEQAYQEKDNYASVSLLNEMIGLSRETGDKKKGIDACNKAVLLMKKLGLEDTVDYAITLLNVANAYRAFKFQDDSLYIFKEVEGIFNTKLEPGDFNYASLYNNWSLLYQDMQEYQNARLMQERALAIVDRNPKAILEQATTRSNLAATLLLLCKQTKMNNGANDPMCQAYFDMACNYANQAIEIYEADGGRDYHFSAALSNMGDLMYFAGDLDRAVGYYKKALKHHDMHVGRNAAYDEINEKYVMASRELGLMPEEKEEGLFGDNEAASLDTFEDETLTSAIDVNRINAVEDQNPIPMADTDPALSIAPDVEEIESASTISFVGEGSSNAQGLAGEVSGGTPVDGEKDIASKILGMDSAVSAATSKEALANIEEIPDTIMATSEDFINASDVNEEKSFAERFGKNPHIFNSHMERCRAFYKEYGKPMIHEKFGDYEDRIAVGLVGEGSECLGFDDDISKDHDYMVGFCMWLNDSDYREIGLNLQKEYNTLIATYGKRYFDNHMGNATDNNENISHRHGVFSIREFYRDLLHTNDHVIEKLCNSKEDIVLTDEEWMSLEEEDIATVTNGAVFVDELGTFKNARRNLKKYYPDSVWLRKLAMELHRFSQNGQYNYGRMMGRRDSVTAMICVANTMESAMKIVYLLNKKYSPYYKWRYKGIQRFDMTRNAMNILEEIARTKNQSAHWREGYNPYVINRADKIVCLIEELATLILDVMRDNGLVVGDDNYLDSYSKQLIDRLNGEVLGINGGVEDGNSSSVSVNGDSNSSDNIDISILSGNTSEKSDINGSNLGNMEAVLQSNDVKAEVYVTKEDLVNKIVAEEWQQFDKVQNEGGRADCQDDWNTFSIMRKSQYLAWTTELLESFYKDLIDASSKGWNLITEKYGRMMESTTPEKYEEIKGSLPYRDEARKAIQEEIVAIQVEWMEQFAKRYPKMAGNARSIHTYEDNPFNTSYETYLRGELGTYSEDTLLLYGRYVVSLKQGGYNLAYIIMENTAKLYGYESVEDAESKL